MVLYLRSVGRATLLAMPSQHAPADYGDYYSIRVHTHSDGWLHATLATRPSNDPVRGARGRMSLALGLHRTDISGVGPRARYIAITRALLVAMVQESDLDSLPYQT